MGVRVWLQGKKTIFGGSVLILIAIAGAFTGKLSALDAMTVAAAGMSICGIGAKANRFLGALSQVAQAGVDLRLGNRAAAVEDLKPIVVSVAVDASVADAGQAPAVGITSAVTLPSPAVIVPSLSAEGAMKPGPARTATPEDWAALLRLATGGEVKS